VEGVADRKPPVTVTLKLVDVPVVNTDRLSGAGMPISERYAKLTLAGATARVGDPAGEMVPLKACDPVTAVGLVLSVTFNV
jgi:hypothetical protein